MEKFAKKIPLMVNGDHHVNELLKHNILFVELISCTSLRLNYHINKITNRTYLKKLSLNGNDQSDVHTSHRIHV